MRKVANLYPVELPFHHNSHPKVFENARFLKSVQTDAEAILWEQIRNRKLDGFKFRRQHPISRFIADFYCHEAKLVIEVDGKVHEMKDNPEYDRERTAQLESLGIRVIRFSNNAVVREIGFVINKIRAEIAKPHP